jgi:hypothetical protein
MPATKHEGNLKNKPLTPAFHNLKTVTDTLLSPAMDYSVIRETVLSLKKLFTEAVAFDDMEPTNQPHILTESGLAIGPKSAAFCIIDMMRTRKFILGIRDAIEERLRMNPGRPVTILYAGTGPFATLLTPLITVFRPEQLQMVLLEINPVSFHYLQKTIQQFGMEDYLVDIVQADAVTYSIPGNQQPDIIVSETMKPGLEKEPQVSIVANLLSQCNQNPVLIPEMIKVDVCLVGNLINYPDSIITLKTLLKLDAETAVRIKNNPKDVPVLSPGILVTIPELPDSQYNRLVLDTSIRVFRHHVLGFNESGITLPQPLMDVAALKKYPARLLFKYQLESEPGFRVTEM